MATVGKSNAKTFQWLGFDGVELPGSRGAVSNTPDPRARIKNRTKLSTEQLEALVGAFEREPLPSPEQRDALASKLGLAPRAVQIWFPRRALVRCERGIVRRGRVARLGLHLMRGGAGKRLAQRRHRVQLHNKQKNYKNCVCRGPKPTRRAR